MNKKYTDEQKTQIIILRHEGLTYEKIAEKVGINNLTTIRNVCFEAGFPRNKNYPSTRENYAIGQRYNNFVIIEEANCKITKTGKKFIVWRCLCDCGKLFDITVKQIHRGQKSCGCMALGGRFTKGESRIVVGHHKYVGYKYHANERGYSFDLTEEQFIELLFSNCYYCNIGPMSLVKLNCHSMKVNGVDRKDNTKGYSIDNCVACCKFCNRAKGNATFVDFIKWLDSVAIFRNKELK
jgi:hypothetical protein